MSEVDKLLPVESEMQEESAHEAAPAVSEPIPRGQVERVDFDNGDTVACTITYQSGEKVSASVESTGNLAADQASAETKAKEL